MATVRWNVAVSPEVDKSVRMFIAAQGGGRKGDLRHASRYPKLKRILPAHRIGTTVNNLQRAIVLAQLPPLPDGVTADDPNDAFLLAMALVAEADYLVTGDRRAAMLQRGSIGRTRIVTPVTFRAEAP